MSWLNWYMVPVAAKQLSFLKMQRGGSFWMDYIKAGKNGPPVKLYISIFARCLLVLVCRAQCYLFQSIIIFFDVLRFWTLLNYGENCWIVYVKGFIYFDEVLNIIPANLQNMNFIISITFQGIRTRYRTATFQST